MQRLQGCGTDEFLLDEGEKSQSPIGKLQASLPAASRCYAAGTSTAEPGGELEHCRQGTAISLMVPLDWDVSSHTYSAGSLEASPKRRTKKGSFLQQIGQVGSRRLVARPKSLQL